MPPETLEFKTELKQLLHLITHSLYSHREIFLRELISNASDAVNKIKFDSLTHEDRLEGNKDWKIKLVPNQEAGTLTVSDNGIGRPEGHSDRTSSGLGTTIVEALAKQLDARAEILTTTHGRTVSITHVPFSSRLPAAA